MHFILRYAFYFFSLYLGAITSLFTMSAYSIPRTSFYARCLSSYLCLLLCAAYGVVAAIFMRVTGHHRSTQWTVARAFKYTMLLTTGVSFDIVSGQEHLQTRPAVFISNHQSELDVLLLGAVFPPHCAVTAKKSLAPVPFLGWFMSLSGTVFIDRANRQTAMKAFEGAAAEMRRERQSVFIFPEGTRSYATEPMLLPFKKGAFHLAVKAQVDIVPIVAGCYSGVMSSKMKRFRPGNIPVKGAFAISSVPPSFSRVVNLGRR